MIELKTVGLRLFLWQMVMMDGECKEARSGCLYGVLGPTFRSGVDERGFSGCG